MRANIGAVNAQGKAISLSTARLQLMVGDKGHGFSLQREKKNRDAFLTSLFVELCEYVGVRSFNKRTRSKAPMFAARILY